MKVILDVSSVHFPLSGIGRYTLELATRLANLEDSSNILFYKDGEIQSKFCADLQGSIDNTKKYKSLKDSLKVRPVVALYRFYKYLVSYFRLYKYRDYIFHAPNFTLPAISGKSIVTVHDLSVVKYPEFHPLDRVRFLRQQIKNSIDSSDLVITDTEAVKLEILDEYNVDASKVRSIHLAANSDFKPRSYNEISTDLESYGLTPGGYILTVSTIEPRKNHLSLFTAYLQLPVDIRRQYPLVVVGAYGWAAGAIKVQLESMVASGELIYLNYVCEDKLPVIYSGAAVFTFMSIYEGFGLPVLEAMQSGVPVVHSTNPALIEVGGSASIALAYDNTDAIALALETILTDKSVAENMVSKGLAQARNYNWDKSIDAVANCYRALQIENN